MRKPPNAVANRTAGKYRLKANSGRISDRIHRASVASARQRTAKPAPKSSDGCEIPYQPRRNSSAHLVICPIQPTGTSKIRPTIEEKSRWQRQMAAGGGSGLLCPQQAGMI